MTLYYAASTNGFYDGEEFYPSLPDDAVEIPYELRDTLLAKRATDGFHIVPGPNGYPQAVPPE